MVTRVWQASLDWRPKTPFYYGWLVLAMLFLSTFAATGVSQAVLAGIQDFIFEDMNRNRSAIAFGATAGTWAAGLISPLIGRWADQFGPRWLMPAGLILGGVSFFFPAGIQAVWHFYVVYIFGRSLSGQVLIGLVPRTTTVNFFRRQRNVALAITSTFRPVGVAINIMVMSVIATRYSWRTAYHYLTVLSFLLVIPLFIVMRRRPEDIGLLPDGATTGEFAPAGRGGPGRAGMPAHGVSPELSWTVREAFSTRAMWLMAATSTLATISSSSLGFSLKPYLVDVGISQTQAAAVLSLGTVLAIVNIGWGFLAERFTPRYCLVLALLMTAVMTYYLVTVNSLLTAYIFAVWWCLSSRAVGTLEHMMVAQYYGRDSYGSILGALGPIQTMGLGLGPGLGAVFRDVFGNYTSLYTMLIAGFLASAVFIFFARPPAPPARLRTGTAITGSYG